MQPEKQPENQADMEAAAAAKREREKDVVSGRVPYWTMSGDEKELVKGQKVPFRMTNSLMTLQEIEDWLGRYYNKKPNEVTIDLGDAYTDWAVDQGLQSYYGGKRRNTKKRRPTKKRKPRNKRKTAARSHK